MSACSSGCGSLRFTPVAARRSVFGQHDPLMQRCQSAVVRNDVARVEFDIDLVPGLANFHAPPDPGDRNRVTNGIHRDIAFHVHRALMQPVHFGNPCRQRFQVQPLDGEQFARHGAKVLLIG